MGMIYLDNAATSFPKPPGVAEAVASGHKGLLGPQGTGLLFVREGLDVIPWREGGTGTDSACLEHPGGMPLRLEAGTQNLPGVHGLAAGVDYVAGRVGRDGALWYYGIS